MSRWVTTCGKIWLTCFMWHFNFLTVNQWSWCIFLIALLGWQLMIDLVLGWWQKYVITQTSMQMYACMFSRLQVRPTCTWLHRVCAKHGAAKLITSIPENNKKSSQVSLITLRSYITIETMLKQSLNTIFSFMLGLNRSQLDFSSPLSSLHPFLSISIFVNFLCCTFPSLGPSMWLKFRTS